MLLLLFIALLPVFTILEAAKKSQDPARVLFLLLYTDQAEPEAAEAEPEAAEPEAAEAEPEGAGFRASWLQAPGFRLPGKKKPAPATGSGYICA